MTKKNYLLTVVIPTRNRQEYAIKSLEQVLAQTNDDVEIVLQDNSDDDRLRQLINNLNSNRIRYNYLNTPLSFVDNFELAVSLARGEYVVLIGDDDAILPNIIDICYWAKKLNVEAVTSDILCTYYWPNSGATNYKCTEDAGYMRVLKADNNLKIINSKEKLKEVLKNGCQFYHKSGLPKIYHGIVKREIIEDIVKKNGRLFSGLSPDIYSSFQLALNIKETYKLNIPFTIDGNCPKSGAGSQAQGKHTGKLKDAPHFKGHNNYHWDDFVPEVYSIQTIWADSGLKAIRESNNLDLLKFYSIHVLTAHTIAFNKGIKYETFKSYIDIMKYNVVIGFIHLIPSFIFSVLPNVFLRISKRILGRGQVGTIYNNLQDIEKAVDCMLMNEACQTFKGGN